MTEVRKPKIHVPAALSISQEHIDDLKAGEQLNALVYIHVFGWKAPAPAQTGTVGDDIRNALATVEGGEGHLIPRFSESFADGNLLLEELRKQKRKVTLQFSGKRWSAWILSDPATKPDADASSLLVAICRAALKAALGHEVVEVPASRTRNWKAWMREEIGKIRDNPPSTKIRTAKAAPVRGQVEKLKKVQRDQARVLNREE